MVVVDDDRAGQRHDRDHDREARLRGDERGDHAGPAQQLADRRVAGGDRRGLGLGLGVGSSAPLRAAARRSASGRAARQSTIASPTTMNPLAAIHSVLSASPSRSRPASSGLKTRRAEDRAEDRAEQHERDPARAALRRIHVAGGGPREQPGRAGRADEHEPGEHGDGPALRAAQRGQQRSRRSRSRSRRRASARGPCGPSAARRAAPPARRRRARSPDPGRAAPRCRSTRTSVSDATAAPSCSIAEFIASELDSSAVLRRIGSGGATPWPPNATRRRRCVERVSRRVHDSTHRRRARDVATPARRPARPVRLRGAHARRLARDRRGARRRDRRRPPPRAAPLEKTTTSYATIGGDAAAPYSRLKLQPGWKRVVRDDLGAAPRKGRLARRRSLLYFAQLSDFQLADEESPARAEVLDLAEQPVHLGVAPAGGARAVHGRRGRSARSTASTQARSATARAAARAWR